MIIAGYRINLDALLARIVYRWHWNIAVVALVASALIGVAGGFIPPSGEDAPNSSSRPSQAYPSMSMGGPGLATSMQARTLLWRPCRMGVDPGRVSRFGREKLQPFHFPLDSRRRVYAGCRPPRLVCLSPRSGALAIRGGYRAWQCPPPKTGSMTPTVAIWRRRQLLSVHAGLNG